MHRKPADLAATTLVSQRKIWLSHSIERGEQIPGWLLKWRHCLCQEHDAMQLLYSGNAIFK